MTSSHHGLYRLGYTHATNKIVMRFKIVKWRNLKLFFQFELKPATRFYEVEIASNRKSACYGEIVLRFCTHRPSRAGSRSNRK